MLASMHTKPVSKDSKDKFIDTLCIKIEEMLGEHELVILSVDYTPCRALYDTAETAGISTLNFPWKTVMWIREKNIRVRYGYCADIETIYEKS